MRGAVPGAGECAEADREREQEGEQTQVESRTEAPKGARREPECEHGQCGVGEGEYECRCGQCRRGAEAEPKRWSAALVFGAVFEPVGEREKGGGQSAEPKNT